MTDRKEYSDRAILKIRKEISDKFPSENHFTVITNGSYARKEASDESDLDWIIIFNDDLNTQKRKSIKNDIKSIINKNIIKNVGSTGTFGDGIDLKEMKNNFGGNKDSNESFTRRMLLLLESEWLLNEEMFKKIRKDIVEIYIKDGIPDSNINRFMLNDIIRYYRTICTDYEYKTTEEGKSWGVRKIKLRFSRKLIYFSGVLTVAATSNLTRDEKIEKTLELLSLPPLDRVINITENKNISIYYNRFLDEISKPEIRDALDKVERENRSSNDEYRKLKNLSEKFGDELDKSLRNSFTSSHPIHTAMIF